jgi:hypothetical protein
MEIILSDDARQLTFRLSDGTEESHDTHAVLGYRHALTDGEDAGDSCEYRHAWRTYRVTRTFPDLWQGRTVQAVWSIEDGQPQWVYSDPLSGETLLTQRGCWNAQPSDTPYEILRKETQIALMLHVEEGLPQPSNFPYSRFPPPGNPYTQAILDLRDALIERGALLVYLEPERGGYGFEINTLVRALELPLFEPNFLYGRSDPFLQGVADENQEDVTQTRQRSERMGEVADWFQDLADVLKEVVVWDAYGENLAVVPMPTIVQYLAQHSPIREAIRLSVEEGEVMLALARHGHYDPTHGHEPPPGQELDALGKREQFHDMWNDAFPVIVDLFRWRKPEGDAI